MKIKEERERLESLLDTASEFISDDVPSPGNIPEELQAEPTIGIDFTELREQCNKEAREMIDKAVSFILSKEMIKENGYIKDKLAVDVMSLSGMVYQLRVNEAMQKALMTEVDRGMINPRMFEVFSGLSKTISEINKQLLGTVEAIKSTYKEIKNDIREKESDAIGEGHRNSGMLGQGDDGVVTLGTKELVNNIKNRRRAPDRDLEDIEEIG